MSGTGPVAMRSILLGSPDVVSKVGNRIYPDYLQEDSQLPALLLWTISATPFDCMDGGMGFEKGRVRLEAYAETRQEADQLWLAANKALSKDLKRGVHAGVLVDGITQSTGVFHMADRPVDGSDRWRYRSIQTFEITYYLYEKD